MKNQEIKFRGLDKETKKWLVSPGFLKFPDGTIILKTGLNEEGNLTTSPIIAKSLGQFTGIKDKNGKDIYEADIIKRVTEFDDGGGDTHLGVVTHNELEACYYLHSIKNELSRSFGKAGKNTTYEVIGNIYETPELLNG